MYLIIAPYWNWNSIIAISTERPVNLIIAPYWNWNAGSGLIVATGGTLIIAPYWNWNGILFISIHESPFPYNRTILELKQLYQVKMVVGTTLIIAPYWNWNSINVANWLESEILIIAPYWNWNDLFTGVASSVIAYNRTILELKRPYFAWTSGALFYL